MHKNNIVEPYKLQAWNVSRKKLTIHVGNNFTITSDGGTGLEAAYIYSITSSPSTSLSSWHCPKTPIGNNSNLTACSVSVSISSLSTSKVSSSLQGLKRSLFAYLFRPPVVHYCTLSLSDLWVTRQECKVGTPYMRV